MSRYIDADVLIADMQERYCKPCKEKGEDYNEVRCRVCWVDDAIDDVDGFADNSIDIVRCKKCIDFVYDEQYKCYGCANDNGLMGEINPDDFCSYGEREGE